MTKVRLTPATPPTSDIPPDDMLCTWVVQGVGRGSSGKPYWVLKYIHAGCREHASLPRARQPAEGGVRRLLDLGSGIGIVAEAYVRAGFRVTGVDIEPQPRYRGHEFIQADMLDFPLDGYDFIHLSAPCQRWSKMTRCRPGLAESYPDLITPMRPRITASGIPGVIENVDGAPLEGATWLCSCAFDRELYRLRGWEGLNGFRVPPLAHPEHTMKTSKAGHWVPGTVMSIAGHIAPVSRARELMGVDWYVPRDALVEAVPVYMTSYVASHALAYLSQSEAA